MRIDADTIGTIPAGARAGWYTFNAATVDGIEGSQVTVSLDTEALHFCGIQVYGYYQAAASSGTDPGVGVAIDLDESE